MSERAQMPSRKRIRMHLIAAGVKNLREYGYPECTADNILTDQIYRAFFRGMLADNKGKGGFDVDVVIGELESEMREQGR